MAEHNCVAVTATLLLLFVTLVRSQEDGGCRRISQYLDDMYIKCQAPPDPDKLYMDADLDPIPGGAQWLIRVPDNGPDQGYEIHKIGVAWRHLCRNGHVNSTLPAEGEYTLIASVYHRNAKPIKVSLPVNITLEDRLSATQGYSGSENAALNYISEDFIPFTAHEHEIIQVSISFVNHKNESIAVLNEGNACPECVELSYRVYRVGCDFPNNFDCLSAYFRWKKDLETSPEYCFPPYVITNLAGMYDRCFVPPTITYVSPNVNVFLFESATLVCLSEGSPDPDIRWYREGKQETISYNNYLHVNRVTWNNRGRYVCEAENMVGKVNTTRPITLGIFDRTCNNYKVKEDDFLETCSSNGRYEPSEISDWPEVIATSADATLTDIEIDNALFHREPEYEADDDPDCEPHLGRGKLVSFTVNIFDLTEVPEDETTGSPDIPSTVVTKEMLSITVDSSSMRTTDATTTIMEHDSADMTQEMTNSDPKPLDNSAIMDVTEEQYMHIPTNPKHAPVGYTRPPSTRSVRNRQKNDDEHDDDDDDNSEKNSQGNRRNLMNPGNRATDTSTQSRQRDFSPGGVPQTIREITSHSPTSTIQTAASRPGISEKLILSKTFSNVYSVAPDPLCMKKTETLKVSIVSEGVDVLRGHRLRVEILDSDGNLLERRCEGETCTALWYRSFQTDCNTTANGQCLSAYFQWKNILSNVRGKKCARARNFDRKFEPCTRVVLPRAHLTVDGTYRVSTKDHRRLRCQVSGDPTPRVQWLSNSSPLENSAQDNTYNFSRSQAGNYTLECQASNMFDTIKSNPVTLTVFEWKEAFCLEELAGGLTWPRTAEGQQALSTEKCPAHREFRGLAKATRNCLANLNGASWGPVEKQKCGRKVNINTELQHLTEVEITENNVETVATQLSDLTTGYANFTSTGVTDTADVLVNIVAHTNSSLVSKEIVNSLSNLMQVDQATLGESQETAKASQKTIMALESYLEKVELKGNQTVLQAVDEQIGIEVIQDEPVAFQDGIGFVSMVDTQGNDGDEIGDLSVQKMPDNVVKMDNRTDASIMIPPSVLNYTDDNSDKVRFTFVIYKTAALFQSSSLSVISDDNREVTKIVNSRIIAGSLATAKSKVENLTEPVVVKFRPVEAKSDEIINTSQCVFWDFDANDGYGDWSSNGCHFVGVEDGRVVCRCNHLTNFAVLMDVHRNQPDAVHLFALDTISKIGCLLSIIGLSATLATYLGFKKLRKTRPQRILINQCIALLCLMLVFIAGIDQTHSYWGCISVAVLLHFFTLAAFMWMGMEAFNMYMAFIRVMPMYISYFMVKIGIIAWGVPLLAVVITLSLGVENYVSGKEYCFMAHYPFYYAYVIPIAVILLYNLVVYTRVIMRLCAKSQATTMDKPQHLHMRWQIRNSICILLLLGLTWIFAFFAVEEVTLLFQYLFCVFNSMQGFFIFIFYCLDQKDAREQWKSACSVCPCFRKKRKKYKYRSPGFDLIYHNPTYTTSQSHRSSISSTKQFSLASKDSVGVNHQTTQTTSPLPHFVQ